MGIQELVRVISAEAPSGEDLEFDPDYLALERASRPREERQVGNQTLPAEEPDYNDVAKRARDLLERSHDLRSAVLYLHAATVRGGFTGLAEGTGYIRAVLEQFWDTCYPALDHDDPDDLALFRVNTLRGLTDGATVIRAVRRAPLTFSTTFGGVSLNDIEVADGERTPRDGEQVIDDPATISAAFQDSDATRLVETADALRRSLGDLRAVEAVFDEKVPGQGPDFAALARLLQQALRRLESVTGGPPPPPEVETSATPPVAPPAQLAPRSPAPSGAITSPQDVRQALDRILDYYRKHEPSSPLPILLERAKRLVGADFVSIMKDMAPEGLENVYRVGGIEESEDE